MIIPLLLLSLASFSASAVEEKKLERLNFFPASKAFGSFTYRNQKLKIDTPEEEVNTNEVNNFSNQAHFEYAYRVHPKVFLGATLLFENASENAIRYGVPLEDRFDSTGWREPGLFVLTRLREQTEESGLIDLYLFYLESFGPREVGNDESNNRFVGRDLLSLALSQGMKEGEWEFKSAVGFTYNGVGEEKNFYDGSRYLLKSSTSFSADFSAQYQLRRSLFALATLGVTYYSDQDIKNIMGPEDRQLQAGSGSFFRGGLKYVLSPWNLLQLQFQFQRNDYYVRGDTSNLDGRLTFSELALTFTQAF